MTFFPDLPDAPLKAAPVRSAPKAKRQVLNTGARGCDACPMKSDWPQLTSPRMKMGGNLARGDILLLGGVPEADDDFKGEHFVGTAGKLLMKAISPVNRQRLVYSHVQRCQNAMSGTTTVSAEAAHACSVHLDDDLDKLEIKAIIGVGQDALKRVFPGAQVREIYGLPFAVEINKRLYWYYPVFDTYPFTDTKKYQNPDYASGYTVLKADLKRFFNIVDSLGKPTIDKVSVADVIIPKTRREADQLMKQMDDRPIGVDLEATCLLPYTHKARILTGAFSDGKTTLAFNINHSLGETDWGLQFLYDVLAEREWVAHFATMELKWFRFFGPHMKLKPFHDSAALARLHNERKYALNLGEVCRIHVGVNVKTLSNLVVTRLDEYPVEEVLRYNGLDAWACRRVYDKLIDKVNPRNYKRLIASVDTCTGMELMGLPTSQPAAHKLLAEWGGKIAKAEEKIRNLYEVKQFELVTQKEFDLGSTQQLALIISKFGGIRLPKTDAGNLKTDEATLKALAGEHPLVQAILNHREATKQVSTYVTPILDSQILYPDKLVHAAYGTYNTHTLRLSSENPNAQNFPKRRHREVRRSIEVPVGCVLVPVDYAQLEARILAMVSRDVEFCKAIIAGFDIHSFWLNQVLAMYPEYMERLAQKTNSDDEAKIRKGGRDIIKTDFVFASFYGSSARACSEKTDVPLEIMEALSTKFWRIYTGVKTWQTEQREIYRATGSIYTVTGRTRHDVTLGGNEVINNPIQGVAADVVADAMNELAFLSRKERDPYLHPRMQIHDDLTFILPDHEQKLEEYLMRIFEVMTAVRNKWQIVPFAVEASIGYNWCDTSPLMVYTGEYNRR